MATLASPGHSVGTAETVALVEAYVGSLFDYLPSALVMTDAQGTILRMNPEAARLLGGHIDATCGRSIHSVIPFLADRGDADARVGMVPGRPGRPLRVRCARVACPPLGALIYGLEDAATVGHGAPLPRARSRFAPSRWARF